MTPTIPTTINPLEETPRNALAFMFVMSSLIEAEHDDVWRAIQNAVHGIGYFYVDLQDRICADCCPAGQN